MLASKTKSYRLVKLHGKIMGGESEEEILWHAAGRCDSGQCVQVGTRGQSILIRSTVDPDGTFATLSRDEWHVFIAGVKDGDFDSI